MTTRSKREVANAYKNLKLSRAISRATNLHTPKISESPIFFDGRRVFLIVIIKIRRLALKIARQRHP